MPPNRYYSATAVETTLSSSITNTATSMALTATTGFPASVPYTLVLDPDLPEEEIVTVTAVGANLTITRAVDGSSAVAHAAGAKVIHAATARDFREPQDHLTAVSAVHGVSGALVGTTDTQTLLAKTLQAASASAQAVVVKGAASQTGNLVNFATSSGTVLANISAKGSLEAGAGSLLRSETESSSTVPALSLNGFHGTDVVRLFAKANSGQTADLVQVQNSTAGSLFRVRYDGLTFGTGFRITDQSSDTTSNFFSDAPSTFTATHFRADRNGSTVFTVGPGGAITGASTLDVTGNVTGGTYNGINLTTLGNWANITTTGNANWYSASVSRASRIGNTVHLRITAARQSGTISSGSTSTTILTLPSGYRPAYNTPGAVGTNGGTGIASIRTDGSVLLLWTDGGVVNGTDVTVSATYEV